MRETLLKKLTEYSNTVIPFHMPGHKRAFKKSPIPYSIDITEVNGFDNLHDMKGVLKDTAKLAEKIYGSIESFPLVNGSTCGILAGIYSLTRCNKNILIARNCHKSVYNAAEILGLNIHYVMPEICDYGIFGKIDASQIEEKIKLHKIGTVVITSPTYDGIISDVSSIYELCTKYNARLIIDCAHGAHFPCFHRECDICVMSLHKTLPSLTQTAILNVHSRNVDLDILRHGLSIFETSSPSYILLASIDECLRYMLNPHHNFNTFNENLKKFYKDTGKLKNIKVSHFDDIGKIIISGANGFVIAEKLRKAKIETEMASENYVLAMATICDTKRSLNTLKKALFKIDKDIKTVCVNKSPAFALPEKTLDVTSALNTQGDFFHLEDCLNKTSLEYIWAYPPGAPIVVPGEIFSKEIIEYLKSKKDLKTTRGKFPQIFAKQ